MKLTPQTILEEKDMHFLDVLAYLKEGMGGKTLASQNSQLGTDD